MKIIVTKPNKIFAAFSLGMIFGAIIATLTIGGQIDSLYYANRELELKLENTLAELEETKANLSKTKDISILRISPKIKLPQELSSSTQETEKLQLIFNEEILKYYKPLIGQPLKSLEPELLPQIINGRIVKIEQKQYQLFVKTIVLSETLHVEIEVEEKN